MKTLIVLDGALEGEKSNWIKKEGLRNFLVKFSDIKRLFCKPELKGGQEILVGSKNDQALEILFKILCHKMDLGVLIVLDLDSENIPSIDDLCLVYGYIKFEKSFNSGSGISGISNINEYFEKTGRYTRKLGKRDPVVYISDLHSNWTTYQEIKRQFPRDTKLKIYLGDYIDGPEKGGSRKVLDYILSEAKDNNSIVALEGNHELRLRKFLGYYWLRSSRKALGKVLQELIHPEFLNNTASEFRDISQDPYQSRLYLEDMNSVFQEYVKITKGNLTIYCTHAGLRSTKQLSPKYIGSVIYGTRNVDQIDREFSEKEGKGGLWSVHAHCHYQKSPLEHFKYRGTINLDPRHDGEVLCYIDKYNKVISQHK